MAQIKITEKPVALQAEEDMRFVATQTPAGEEEADVRLIPPEAVPWFANMFGSSDLVGLTFITQEQYDALERYDNNVGYIIWDEDLPSAGGQVF